MVATPVFTETSDTWLAKGLEIISAMGFTPVMTALIIIMIAGGIGYIFLNMYRNSR